MRAVVVFESEALGWAPRLFCGHRKHFKHCWVATDIGGCWVSVEYSRQGLEVRALVDSSENLADKCRQAGGIAIELTDIEERSEREYLPQWFSCVELTKRMLGIRAWRVWTPWQLYRYLERKHGAAWDDMCRSRVNEQTRQIC